MRDHPPFVSAGNAGPFTLDGTRTYRVGTRRVALIDPGPPDLESHLRALASWVEQADEVVVLLTHGHKDHAGGAPALAALLGARVAGPGALPAVDLPLADGESVPTDQGALVAVHTPGHARDHLCYHWLERSALFAGDLVLGKGDTTWVGEYPGCVADYLRSLQRVRDLAPAVIYPAHGPPIERTAETLDRYEAHRLRRIRQVEEALAAHPGLTPAQLLSDVYGRQLPAGMERAALRSVEAMIEHVRIMSRPGQ